MSELKATTIYDAYWKANSTGEGTGILVYIKSEADKVIAELEDDCTYWKTMSQKNVADNEVMAKQRAEAFKQRTEALKRERHHKFKRCLDEAKICQLRLERYERYLTEYKNCNDPTIQRWRFLKDHYEKWYMRWLKIAEQFKEAK